MGRETSWAIAAGPCDVGGPGHDSENLKSANAIETYFGLFESSQQLSQLRTVFGRFYALDRSALVFASRERDAAQTLAALLDGDLLLRLVLGLGRFDFEVQKEVTRIFVAVLQNAEFLGSLGRVQRYVTSRPGLLDELVDGCGQKESCTHCAAMLRALARHSEIVARLCDSAVPMRLLRLAEHEDFEISAEAFASLHDLLLVDKATSGAYLEEHFEDFFVVFQSLLVHEAYVVRRQALKLLGSILLDREFSPEMRRYTCSSVFLKSQMNLLRDNAESIRIGAFHIFKLFVANPEQPLRVRKILERNHARLINHLESAVPVGMDDDALKQDLDAVVSLLNNVGSPTTSPV